MFGEFVHLLVAKKRLTSFAPISSYKVSALLNKSFFILVEQNIDIVISESATDIMVYVSVWKTVVCFLKPRLFCSGVVEL